MNPFVRRLACAAWLVVASPALADAPWSGPGGNWSQFFVGDLTPQPAQPPHPAVVRIVVPQRDSTSYGSGTLVAAGEKYGVVITNWHVIHESSGLVLVRFPDGFQSAATILKTDREWDLAALGIWKSTATPVPLATSPPRPGDVLTIAGYGSGNYRAAVGRCTQYVAPGERRPFEMVEVSAAARQGDSGGPIFNQRGELAGVLFGEGGGHTAGSYCGRVHQFLANVTPIVSSDGSATPLGPASPAMIASTLPPVHHSQPPPIGLRSSPSPSSAPMFQPVRPGVSSAPLAAAPPMTTRTPLQQFRPKSPPSVHPPAAAPVPITLDDILGTTPLDRLKSALAGIGALTVLWMTGRTLARKK